MITVDSLPELRQMLDRATALRTLADAAALLGASDIRLGPECYGILAEVPHRRTTWCYADGTAIDQATVRVGSVSITAASPDRRSATADELARRPGTAETWPV